MRMTWRIRFFLLLVAVAINALFDLAMRWVKR